MILTDYYCFEHKADTKSKTRIDCVISTESYPQFEALRNKENILFLYVGDNTHTNTIAGHFVCRINRKYYDCNGEYTPIKSECLIKWTRFKQYDELQYIRIVNGCIL